MLSSHCLYFVTLCPIYYLTSLHYLFGVRPFQSKRDTYAQHWKNYDQSEASGSSTSEPFST